MDTLLVPDLLAISILIGVLALVRRRYPKNNIRLWMGGLLLILLECVARLLYGLALPIAWHRALHIVALEAYLLAGVLFLRTAHRLGGRLPRAGLFTTLNTVPATCLLAVYGADMRGRWIFVGIALCGLAITVVSCIAMRRPRSFLFALLCLWTPGLIATLAGTPRDAVYVTLASLYLLISLCFLASLPRRSSGKIAVVSGFALWSACFATHPWIAVHASRWIPLASEVWNMQKFLITIGFLVVLFEEQVNNNEWMALHDPLTGLANRRLFQDRLSNALARAELDRTALILFCLDLNHFKHVNDTLGHDAGDTLLRHISASLQRVVRRTDTLARLGGDEFTLLATDVRGASAPRRERRWRRSPEYIEGLDEAHAPVMADTAQTTHSTEQPVLRHAARIEHDIRAAVEGPVVLEGREGPVTIQVSVSIGVAVYPTDSTSFAELTHIADQRMYEDKARQNSTPGGMSRVLSLLSTS